MFNRASLLEIISSPTGIGIIVTAVIFVVSTQIINFAIKQKKEQHHIFYSVILKRFKQLLLSLIVILSIYFIVNISFYQLNGELAHTLKLIMPNIVKIKDIAIILTVSWYALKTITDIGKIYTHKAHINILIKLSQISIIVSSTFFIFDKFGLNISGILTFGGISGIAAGLAAKDLLANFFGSIAINLDRPFTIGDRIISPDKEISGTVKEIGWRLTQIMTYEKRPIYIPNSLFATIIVQNDSRMTHRRINDKLRIRFEKIESITIIRDEVERMLKENRNLDTHQTTIARLDAIGDKIFTLHLYAFTNTTEWKQYKIVREHILLKTASIITSLGCKLVFPEADVETHEEQLYITTPHK